MIEGSPSWLLVLHDTHTWAPTDPLNMPILKKWVIESSLSLTTERWKLECGLQAKCVGSPDVRVSVRDSRVVNGQRLGKYPMTT